MKKVHFNDNVKFFTTYSYKEYDRSSIDHVIFRRINNLLSGEDISDMYLLLDIYKLYEMPVHKMSIYNNSYSLKKLFQTQ